jgi:hypothetical protein
MKYKLTRILFHIREFQSRRENAYFGTSLFEKINPNPFLQLFISLAMASGIYFLFKNIHYLSDFLFWFVGVLEITKVLKIPFLDNIKYYQYLSIFVFFYLVISLLWDLSRILSKLGVNIYLIRDEIWMIEKKGFGNKLTKFRYLPEDIQVEWHHSGLLNYLGLNQVFWKKQEILLAFSPYFFPYGKNKALLNKILKR